MDSPSDYMCKTEPKAVHPKPRQGHVDVTVHKLWQLDDTLNPSF